MTAAALPLREADFQAQIVQLAQICGWRTMHVRRSIGRGRKWTTATSMVGWPDLALYHPDRGRFLMRELKADSGQPSAQQLTVLADLRAAGVDAGIWRPSDWDLIQVTLTHPGGRPAAVGTVDRHEQAPGPDGTRHYVVIETTRELDLGIGEAIQLIRGEP